jgi:hypothetical protein
MGSTREYFVGKHYSTEKIICNSTFLYILVREKMVDLVKSEGTFQSDRKKMACFSNTLTKYCNFVIVPKMI